MADPFYRRYLSEDLIFHLDNPAREEINMEYQIPDMVIDKTEYEKEPSYYSINYTGTLPKALESPLEPWTDQIRAFMSFKQDSISEALHPCLYDNLVLFKDAMHEYAEVSDKFEIGTTIDSMKEFILTQFEFHSPQYLSHFTSFANYAYGIDTSVAALSRIEHMNSLSNNMEYSKFIDFVWKVRHQDSSRIKVTKDNEHITLLESSSMSTTLVKDSIKLTLTGGQFNKVIMLDSSCAFALISNQKMIVGPRVYLDYLVTFAESLLNISIIISINESTGYHRTLRCLIRLMKSRVDHKICVELMKSFETLCLHLSDRKERVLVNWTPVLDVLKVISDLSTSFGDQLDMLMLASCLDGKRFRPRTSNLVWELFDSLLDLSGSELQEASSLHKNIFISEIDTTLGMEKYLKRTHTYRPILEGAAEELACYAKKEFLLSYMDKHKRLPPMRGNLAKISRLNTIYNSSDKDVLYGIEPMFLIDVTIWNALDDKTTSDPLEYAKDKSSCKECVRFSPGDSQRELIALLKDRPYEVHDLPLEDFIAPAEPRVTKRGSQRLQTKYRYPTRLCVKEREQKVEGRFFGSATHRNKHALSRMMVKAKSVLSYFKGEMMTISDKNRKIALHNAAQNIKKDKHYSILLDIEGHNQSMQYHNAGPIFRVVGEILGHDNWDLLCNYFGHNTIFFYHPYKDEAIVTEGQLGGIEGWYNPIWTLHTLMAIKRTVAQKSLIVTDILVYSDDVNIVCKFREETPAYINMLFREIQTSMFEVGMICKITQTAISKHRCTILRVHYFDGIRADSTFKRIISTSMFKGDTIHSDVICLQSLSSSCDTAYDMTNKANIVTYFRWFRLSICALPMLKQLFKHRNKKEYLMGSRLPESIQKVLFIHNRSDNTWDDVFTETRKNIALRDLQVAFNGVDHITHDQVVNKLKSMYGNKWSLSDKIDIDSAIEYLVGNSYDMKNILLYILMMPYSMGGFGVQSLINNMVSGNSDGFLKTLTYCKQSIKYMEGDSKYIMAIFNVSLNEAKFKHQSDASYSPDSIWPTYSEVTTSTSLIQGAVKKFMRSICTNDVIKEHFDLDAYKQDFSNHISRLLKNSYNPRIKMFFMDHSKFHILESLLGKVDNSTGLVNKVKNRQALSHKIRSQDMVNLLRLFEQSGDQDDNPDFSVPVLSQLQKIRSNNYSELLYDNIDEPIYDEIIEECAPMFDFCGYKMSSNQYFKDGIIRYVEPPYGSSVLYKGEVISDNGVYRDITSYLSLKLVGVTRWLLVCSSLDPFDQTKYVHHPFYHCCISSLATMTSNTYEDIVVATSMALGGEIRHRIPNLRFRTSSHIMIHPNEVTKYAAWVTQSELKDKEWLDSNINVELLRHRMMAAGLSTSIFGKNPSLIKSFNFSNVMTIKDVRVDKPDTLCGISLWQLPEALKSKQSGVSIEYLDALSYGLSIQSGNTLSVLSEEVNSDISFSNSYKAGQEENYILSYYKQLIHSHMAVHHFLIREEIWLSLVKRLRKISPKFAAMDEGAAMSKICGIINDHTVGYFKGINETKFDKAAITDHIMSNLTPNYSRLREVISYLSLYDYKSIKDSASMLGGILLTVKQILGGNMERSRTRLARLMSFYMTLTYCAVYYMRGGILYLDEETTYDASRRLIFIERNEPLLDNLTKVVYYVFGRLSIDINLANYAYDVIEEINAVLDRIHFYPEIDANYAVSHDTIYSDETPVSQEDMCPGASSDVIHIGDNIEALIERLSSARGIIRDCSSLYSNIAVSNSYTGSDSMVPQYHLFRKLIELKIIDISQSRVADMTAGRGDGHMALKALGVTHKSVTKSDIFTTALVQSGVEVRQSYDIMDVSTWTDLLDCDFMHIDISFIGSDELNGWDVISTVLMRSDIVCLRINSLRWPPMTKSQAELLKSCHFLIVYPNMSNYIWYQLYLIVSRHRYDHVPTTNARTIFHTIMNKYIGNKSILNILTPSSTRLVNSITAIFDTGRFIDIMLDYMHNIDSQISRFKIEWSIPKMTRIFDGVLIPRKKYSQYIMKKNELLGEYIRSLDPVNKEDIEIDEYSIKEDNVLYEGVKSESWSSIVKRLGESYTLEDDEEYVMVNKDRFLGDENSYARSILPFKWQRQGISTLEDMRKMNIYREGMILTDVIASQKSHASELSNMIGDLGSQVRDLANYILMFLCGASYVRTTYKLIYDMRRNNIKSVRQCKLINTWKKLSPLMITCRSEFKLRMSRDIETLQEIVELMRNTLPKLFKRKRIKVSDEDSKRLISIEDKEEDTVNIDEFFNGFFNSMININVMPKEDDADDAIKLSFKFDNGPDQVLIDNLKDKDDNALPDLTENHDLVGDFITNMFASITEVDEGGGADDIEVPEVIDYEDMWAGYVEEEEDEELLD